VYNNGTYYLGNSTLAGALDNTFAPVMPLQTDDLPEYVPETGGCDQKVSEDVLAAKGLA